MKIISRLFIILLTASSLSACQQGSGPKQTGGTLLGGLAGGILGAQVGKGDGRLVATGIGALAGALVGSSIGQTLDSYDKQLMEKSSRQALEFSPTGSSVEWNNPDSGHSGSFTPTKTYKNSDNQYCREYTQDVIVGGERQKAYGRACRQPDGNWKIVK